MSTVDNTQFQQQLDKLRTNINEAKQEKSRFSYSYKGVPYPGDINKDFGVSYIATIPQNIELNNAMQKFPMKQTPKTCLLNAGLISTKYVNANSLDSSPYGGTFMPSSKMSQGKATTQLKKVVTQNTRDVVVNKRRTVTVPEEVQETVDVQVTNPTDIFVDGLNMRVWSTSGYVNNNINFANQTTLNLDTSKFDINQTNPVLPKDFSSLRTATTVTLSSKKYDFKPGATVSLYIPVAKYSSSYEASTTRGIMVARVRTATKILQEYGDQYNNIINNNYGVLQTTAPGDANNPEQFFRIRTNDFSYSIAENASSPNSNHYFNVEWFGYFVPNKTGFWKFSTNSDDYSMLWVDSDRSTVVSSASESNATVNNKNLHPMNYAQSVPLYFTANNRYPIKIVFGENEGGYNMVVSAIDPNNITITNFSGGLFQAKFTKDVTTTVQKVQTVVRNKQVEEEYQDTETQTYNVVTYEDAPSTLITSTSLADQYNQSYTNGDPNPVYVSMIKDPASNLYDCYVNTQNADANAKINSLLANAGNISKYAIVNIWQSIKQGNVYNGKVTIPSTVTDGNSTNISSFVKLVIDDNDANFIGTTTSTALNDPLIFMDDQHYLYIKENGREKPELYLIDATAKRINIKSITDIGNTMYYSAFDTYADNIIPMKEWVDAPTFLVSSTGTRNDGTNIVSYTYTEENIKKYNGTLQINGTNYISSANGLFRLIMINGFLTLQMAIDITKTLDKSETGFDNVKYTQNIVYEDNQVDTNSHAIMKVTANNNVNQLALEDKTYNIGFYIPANYYTYGEGTAAGTNYAQYDNVYPFLPPNGNQYVTYESAESCKAKCDATDDCRAYYTFNENGSAGCKIQSFVDEKDSAFNPKQPDSNITNSKLFIKTKQIENTFNPVEGELNIPIGNANPNIKPTKVPYYPDHPELNNNNYFDTVKKRITDGRNLLNSFTEDPNNYQGTNIQQKITDMQSYLAAKLEPASGYGDYSNIANIGFEGFSSAGGLDLTNVKINTPTASPDFVLPTSFSGNRSGTSSTGTTYNTPYSYSEADIKAFNDKCLNGTNTGSMGICNALKQIRDAKTNSDKLLYNDVALYTNALNIINKVEEVDDRFKTLSNKRNSAKYESDFNRYDDKPDTTILGGLRKDVQDNLLRQNAVYFIGTIATATLLILAINISRT